MTNKELLNWLDDQSRQPRRIIFRWSTTGRGWRLMETPNFVIGLRGIEEKGYSSSAREAILAGSTCFSNGVVIGEDTDRDMLDWLDSLTGTYTGGIIFRQSAFDRGWRLHETSREGSSPTVRQAIENAAKGENDGF